MSVQSFMQIYDRDVETFLRISENCDVLAVLKGSQGIMNPIRIRPLKTMDMYPTGKPLN